ncbi:MAG TPA: tRNA pseudouridine(55) synthase TruB [Pseudogracilibacillus sp.]|nr:tRNA pseudouridine(55) synthase TruB [Pseudogracilibacillus sp.]
MHGILPLWKPKGLTSHDCVFKLRKILKTKKVGHTGTLDPEVEGVLPICVGGATKVIPYLSDLKKVYIATLSLGATTDTEDATGKIIDEQPVNAFPNNEQIEQAFKKFTGEIKQIAPMYSAVQVKGKRLYEYARENIEVERPERKITIHDIELLHTNKEKNTIDLKVSCSKGTYIRTLCVDIGKHLGYPAHMSKLKRIESDSFKEDETFTFAEIESIVDKGKHSEMIYPTSRALNHLDTYAVNEEIKRLILFGQKLPLPKTMEFVLGKPYKVMHHDELLAIYHIDPENEHQIRALRVFNEIQSEGD